jgi:two-component system, LytTR family, response regulator
MDKFRTMDKIKAIIVDDEKKACLNLKRILEVNCSFVEIIDIAMDADDAFEKINAQLPDLVFLDVEMPEQSGFDLLEKFQKIFFRIIFVTAYDQYALKAIKHDALDFILKPIDLDDLMSALNKVKDQIGKESVNESRDAHKNHLLSVHVQDGIIFIRPENIIRMEANGSYTQLYMLDNKKIVASKNIKEFEKQLSSDHFFRCHQSHLINLSHIVRYKSNLEGSYLEMSDNSLVELARRRKDEFLTLMNKR